jgi:LemA protein
MPYLHERVNGLAERRGGVFGQDESRRRREEVISTGFPVTPFMKVTKPLLTLIIAVVAVVLVLALVIVTYNGLVSSEQQVESQWAQVENEYQRKIDLIPNLVETTSQYTQFEANTLTNITALRMEWLNALTSEERLNTSIALDGEINTIVLAYFSAENYPTLSYIPLVADLMDELAGTENRIAVERMRYNEDVRDYNSKIKRFPGVMFAGMFGFDEKRYYDPIPGEA